ncbi:hypothetical protein LEP1GSC036_4167 [Leptospira weilii str. 2006001853]|uniref:Uncharacterized protein n=4 Tax=Leptospira weilii TaxID=28184 RepID=A0A828Z1H7_9LEPT|nr:hypothetical protein LEP1GSC036_4167 [Leptospira weilii str. 2006001853]EMJ65224.1 hypothetical protein LEP1GSC051_4158 [Leptospira sp. P2653]EMM72099.1 hypothetical protein LEP1GSC038_3716 [Leptospira weilii str. 2006001855]EMN46472.1 hypothetical protein LEP1GSC086_3342 [Leptospira weilii str. LNT 1234]EMN90079.1 hypothetical protein LEP1GSC108_4760 [Leptospira weilii str. UI 13098]EMY14563.1 hypothetical protein LEP1GSC043_1819 [Leptospira weilii str. Ecochallenge]OMI18662.1 hypothetica
MQSINYQRKIEIGLEEKDARIVYFIDSEYLGFCKRMKIFFPFFSIKRNGGNRSRIDICKKDQKNIGVSLRVFPEKRSSACN